MASKFCTDTESNLVQQNLEFVTNIGSPQWYVRLNLSP